MPARIVKYAGKSYSFPDDATDDEVSQALAAIEDEERSHIKSNIDLAPPSGNPRLSKPQYLEETYPHRPTDRNPNATNFPELTSAENLGGWVESGPGEVLGGLADATNPNKKGTVSAHRILSGTGMTMAPTLGFAAAAAPVATAVGVGTGTLGGKAGRKVAQLSGGDTDTQNLAEDIGNYAGGWAGVKGLKSLPGVARATGRGLTKIGGLPDAPTSELMPRTLNLGAKLLNAGKQTAASVGPRMSRVGLPPPPATEPYVEPDLPTPKPDGQSHYNDVPDVGVRNNLLDAMQDDGATGRQGRDPVGRDQSQHHDDVNPEMPALSPEVPTEDLISQVQRGAVLPSAKAARDVNALPPRSLTPTADAIPTPESDTLLHAIRNAPGWPENGLDNQPWDMIHASDARNNELPDALSTDPYNRPADQQIQGPTYSGPERRGTNRGDIPTPQPFDQIPHPHDVDSVVWHDGEGQWYEGDKNTGDVGDAIDNPFDKRPGLAETTAASDPQGDAAAIAQARSELPQGSLSQHLQRAAQIAAENRAKKSQ